MSHLSEELERQFQKHNTNALQLAERIAARSGSISPSQIYKWVRSEQTSINHDQLVAIATSLSSDYNDHVDLVIAHLRDECFGPGSEMVAIERKSRQEMNDLPRAKSKGEEALAYLATARIKSRDVNELLIDLARCLGCKL